jgi:crotonobetainyl-CoA:carnitine CoA-transferase CaiB-like acyl-CoA transferase
MTTGSLDGIRVLDVSMSEAGSWCTRLLADFGADVVVAEPASGHPLRSLGPRDTNNASITAAYLLANKRSVALDGGNPGARERLLDLARASDVVVSSDSPSRLEAAGLTFKRIASPNLILAHITPFGFESELAEARGNDLSVAARSGWASINGLADREPLKPSGMQVSYCAGLAAFSAIVAAVLDREAHGGNGQEIDVSELDVMVAAFAPALLRGQYQGEVMRRHPEMDLTTGPVPVADGYFALTISRAHFWHDAMNLLGLTDLAEDSRWDAAWYRAAHKDEYVGRVQAAMATWARDRLFEELAARRVVAGPVLTMPELAANEQLRARRYWVRPEQAPDGPEYPGAPFRMSATPWLLRRPVPALGQHTADVLREFKSAATASAKPTTGNGGAGPFAGLRGIVLTQAWAGSFCTELLAFLGADIIQVEVRKRLDSWRGPLDAPIASALRDLPTASHPWNCNPLYNSVNLNKRCITLDLQTTEGLEVFRQLLPHADFVAENFSPRVLGNLGIGFEEMRAIKPDVILCSLSAYGHDGPWANIPGIGGTIEPTSGMSALLGYEGGAPINSGQMYPDAVAGFYGCAAIVAAIRHRNRTGEGQYIDLSMQEAALTFVGDAALEFTTTGRQRPRMGNRHRDFAPHGIYRCAGEEDWVAIACESETDWLALCHAAGRPDWAGDIRFSSMAARRQHEDELDAQISAWTSGLARDDVAAMLSAAGLIAAPVLNNREVAADEFLHRRRMVADVEHPEAGRWPQAVSPFRFSRTSAPEIRSAPVLGGDSREVLRELLGMSDITVEELVAKGVSGVGPPD